MFLSTSKASSSTTSRIARQLLVSSSRRQRSPQVLLSSTNSNGITDVRFSSNRSFDDDDHDDSSSSPLSHHSSTNHPHTMHHQQQQQQQQQQQHQQNQRSTTTTPSSTSLTPGSALSGDFGLLGLLSVIRMTDADRNALALGTDLTSLGLNLNKNEKLYTNFASPFSDSQVTKEPHYQLPMCYYMQPPALKTGHLSKFQLETLFYIFYALPKDVLQAYAAQELYAREWRYHAELKRWFQRDQAGFVYFDINTWERRLFNAGNLQNSNISNGFLSEDDVRVKFPSSSS